MTRPPAPSGWARARSAAQTPSGESIALDAAAPLLSIEHLAVKPSDVGEACALQSPVSGLLAFIMAGVRGPLARFCRIKPSSPCSAAPRTLVCREHHERTGKKTLFKQTIKVSDIDHMLPPGVWVYPFSVQIPPAVPGVTKHKRKTDASDPAWRSAGRKLETKFESCFTVKAVLQTKGVFSRDLKSRQGE